MKTVIVTSDAKESTLLTLKHFQWENLFDVVIGRESTKETKESGAPVKLALKLLKSNPENTLMVGDAPMDFIAAKNGGVNQTILALYLQDKLMKILLCKHLNLQQLHLIISKYINLEFVIKNGMT